MSDRPERGEPASDHAGDLISALLDGELAVGEASRVRAHLDECAPCRAVAEEARAGRDLVRSGPLAGGSTVVEQVIRRRRRAVANGLVFVGAVLVVLGVLSMTSAAVHPDVVPDVERLVAAHVGGHDELDDMQPVAEAGRNYLSPAEAGTPSAPLLRQAVYDGSDLTSVVYADEAANVSVFEQPGRVAWDELPSGTFGRVGEHVVWVRPGRPHTIVTEVGDLAVTMVSDDEDAVRRVLESLPGPTRSSLFDRIHDSCQRLTEVFALGG